MDIRDKILIAAARVYAESGYRGATTRRIAQEAGVNEITLFRHFGSKDSLLLEAMRQCENPDAFPMLPDEPVDPELELREWARAHHAMLYERRSFIRTCMGEMAERPEIGESASKGPHRAAAVLSAYFVRLRDRGLASADANPETASWLLLAAIFADAMWRDVMSAQSELPSAEQTLDAYIRLILRAVGVPVAPGRAEAASTATIETDHA